MGAQFRIIHPDAEIHFDCGNSDLNEYFSELSGKDEAELKSRTYGFYLGKSLVAMFSLSNDRLAIELPPDPHYSVSALIGAKPPKVKEEHWPAVKIGRFAVRKDRKKRGIGMAIMLFIQAFFLIRNKTGCRYLIVEAFPDAEAFYKKSGFERITESEDANSNVHMYYDLIQMKNYLDKNKKERRLYDKLVKQLMNKGDSGSKAFRGISSYLRIPDLSPLSN